MEQLFGRATSQSHQDSEHWMSVSDLMAGLMMVFLFISVAFMRYVLIEQERIKEIAVTYQDTQVAIYESLMAEFEHDLERWHAEIDRESLEFRFKSPEVLFGQGDINLRPEFKAILANFFPRYLSVLDGFHDAIDEVRIEGHTSSVWNRWTSADDAYFNNMELSQGRTRAVLHYVYTLLPGDSQRREWVRRHVAAVGYSSSRLVHDAEGREDQERSRRVTFRVLTNAETQIQRILDG
jgi:outer membrane protein OmpA-like peptidoglycan-associated protein